LNQRQIDSTLEMFAKEDFVDEPQRAQLRVDVNGGACSATVDSGRTNLD
jgi:hypothetical protein